MFLCSNIFLLFVFHLASSPSFSIFLPLLMEFRSDLPMLRQRNWLGCCHLSFPALTQTSVGEVQFFSVCRRASTGSELFSGVTRRTFSITITYCRRASQSYVKRLVVSVDGSILSSLAVARLESKSSFSVTISQIYFRPPVTNYLVHLRIRNPLQGHDLEVTISSHILQRCSAASRSATPIDGLSDNLSVTLMGLLVSIHYCLFDVGLGLEFSLVGLEILGNVLKGRATLIFVGTCDSFSSGKECFVPSITSYWERLILPSSL